MFTRQKYLLCQMMAFGGECHLFFLVKSLFYLFKKEIKDNLYDFHPYHYGPYSEMIYADLRALERKKIITPVGKSKIKITVSGQTRSKLLEDINSDHFYKIQHIASKLGNMSFDELLEAVYKEFPYYAINNKKKGDKYRKYDPRQQRANQDPAIFTIGYEGISIDEFFNRLFQNNIQVLVDARNNPWSMKYGFTGKTLKKLCENRDIEYLSITNLGIPSENRKGLEKIEDYKKLFEEFEMKHMPKVKKELTQLKFLLENGKRIALLCFEKDAGCCHREVVARHLSHYCNEKFKLEHI